jgi:hypothetical protein
MTHVEALTNSSSRERFAVQLPAKAMAVHDAPTVMLDFGDA